MKNLYIVFYFTGEFYVSFYCFYYFVCRKLPCFLEKATA